MLEREAPRDYLNEWTSLLAQTKLETIQEQRDTTSKTSVVVFRLGVEWLALATNIFKEVTQVSTIRTLPHRSNPILLGLANIRGEIQMCISLSSLLNLENSAAVNHQNTNEILSQRMMVVEKEASRWVFPVDEIYGVHTFHPHELSNVPATVSKSTQTYVKGMLECHERNVSYLDDDLLFYILNKKIL